MNRISIPGKSDNGNANIFLIRSNLGPEDRFTAYWHYLVATAPGLGQVLLDYIAQRCNRESTRFIAAYDHPAVDASNHPDFAIEGEGYSILWEHKLDAELGPLQLERYLSLTTPGKMFLGLVSTRQHAISPEVSAHPAYLRPSGDTPHFTWQEFSELLKRNRRKSIVAEFIEFMDVTGLTLQRWGKLGDPFVDSHAEKAIRDVLRKTAKRTRRKGCVIIQSPRSIGMQYRKPLPGIHLICYSFSPNFQTDDRRIAGRTIGASMWVKHDGPNEQESIEPVLSDAYGYLPGTEPRIFVSDSVARSTWDCHLFVERLYLASLAAILGKDKETALKNILGFIAAVEANLNGSLNVKQQVRP